jgi:cobalamin biosynthetic protein CobC
MLGAEIWRRLPSESPGFRKAATSYYGTDRFLAVAGSQAAIQTLPRLIPARSVALVRPTYGEHEKRWRASGAAVELLAEDAIENAGARDVIVLCNPNNPTGRLRRPEALFELRERQAARGAWLVVDEAFVDAEPQLSLAPHAGAAGLVVLRSVGKFFGLAGARVGFLFAPPALLEKAREEVGPWPVSGPALAVTAKALSDVAYHSRSRALLKVASVRLSEILEKKGYEISGATDFFAWVKHPKARDIQDRLARNGILVRAFDDPAGLRFGLAGSDEAWNRLEAALEKI